MPTRRIGAVRILGGYTHAPDGWEHHRRILYSPGEALVVLDRVRGAKGLVRSHLPLAPECSLDESGLLLFPGGRLRLQTLRGLRDGGTASWVGNGFGRRLPRRTVAFQADSEGLIAYALCAPDCAVVLGDASCIIRGRQGSIEVELSA